MPRYKVNANRPFVVLKSPYGRKAANEIFEARKSDVDHLVPLFLSRLAEPKPEVGAEPAPVPEAKDNVVQGAPATKPIARLVPRAQVAPAPAPVKKEAVPEVPAETTPIAPVVPVVSVVEATSTVVEVAELPVATVETTTATEVVVPVDEPVVAPAVPEVPVSEPAPVPAPAPAPKVPAAKESSAPAKDAKKKKEGS